MVAINNSEGKTENSSALFAYMHVSRMTTAPTRLSVIMMSMSWVGRGTTSMTTTPTMAVGTPTNVKRLLRNSELSGPSTISLVRPHFGFHPLLVSSRSGHRGVEQGSGGLVRRAVDARGVPRRLERVDEGEQAGDGLVQLCGYFMFDVAGGVQRPGQGRVLHQGDPVGGGLVPDAQGQEVDAPGLPKLPFILVGVAVWLAASRLPSDNALRDRSKDEAAAEVPAAVAPDSPEGLARDMKVDPLELEVAYNLVEP